VDTQPKCKVCDRGALIKKHIFRMSSPVVAIGFILLIPSILGIVFSALMLVGAIADADTGSQNTLASTESAQEISNDQFRINCFKTAPGYFRDEFGTTLSIPTLAQVCECDLNSVNANGDSEVALRECTNEWSTNALPPIDEYTQGLYLDLSTNGKRTIQPEQPNRFSFAAHILGGGIAVFLGIASFVGGSAWLATCDEEARSSMLRVRRNSKCVLSRFGVAERTV
jgi:hypothetical protein